MKFRHFYPAFILSVIVSAPASAASPDPDLDFPFAAFHAFTQPAAACNTPTTSSRSGKVEKISGDVSARHADDEDWCGAVLGQTLGTGDEIHTGPESEATITFSDSSFVLVRQLTETAIGDLSGPADRPRIRMLLKMGEIAAKVNHEVDLAADFAIRTPTATASVRGTDFVVSYDDQPPLSQIKVNEGVVLVTPANGSLAPLQAEAGQFVQVTTDAIETHDLPARPCRVC
jgi:hypothetical protein